jgi:thiamine pyrophosphokinase
VRTIVVANGPQPAYPTGFVRADDDWIVAADGGSINALRWGWLPDVVVGDLDSLPADLQESLKRVGCQFKSFPARKDWTDLELAVRYASEGGASEIVVVGLRGGRLDQELAGILLLSRPDWSHLSIQILDGRQRAFVVRDSLTLEGHLGDTVSLLPLSQDAVGVTTQGLEWTLRDEDLEIGSTRGVSNVLITSEATIRIGAGVLLVIHTVMGENPFQRKKADQALLDDSGGVGP